MKVSIGILVNSDNELLVSKRTPRQLSPNLWEFPGGKIEPAEDAYEALCREMQEELGIVVLDATYLDVLTHAFDHYSVTMYVYLINRFSGIPQGREGQDVLWLPREQFEHYNFIPSTHQVLTIAAQAIS
ncbi:MAG: hypothetical protein CMF46_05395 [Legionellales bacterium]|nr:hypothetical protein [Legionellales bacterium]|tara:strand:+ start:956 stop:1342 length:387 start_codon:yes stop_codon:yes gene_type:complete